jgi:hypothetical protein
MKGYETFLPARNGSRNCRRDHILLKYKFTSLIRQLLFTIKYIYLIGLASISTIIILILPLVIFDP